MTTKRGQNATRLDAPATAPRTVDHVLITRFNLPTPGPEGRLRQREGWLTGRADLFEKYCLPSVRAQTNQNFRWLVYLDPDSPEWLIQRLAPYVRDQVFEPIYRAAVTPAIILDDIRAGRTTPSADLLTTNLDNDDGLAADFVDRLQRIPPSGPRSALYLASGLILGPDGLFLRVDKLNAFCSVRETWNDPVTCWADWHTLLPRSMPSVAVSGPPAWLQVVHGSNVSNRVRGRLVASSGYAALFPTLPTDLDQPTRTDLLRDRLWSGPARLLRESSRAAVKSTLLFLVGKGGVDRIKVWRSGTTE
ncbi:hypothetical protein RCH12_002392 [Cryobacterium sp. MP_3.1]|uniref:glycosyltransferase n=1 Tax=Cryobacterium sp. MP_3.1 TaxID=3071711 RepID=UPI002E0165F5|nr:hypothetical protein [Cryobacterium sp. MP_3.1]